MRTFNLQIVTPDGLLFDDEAVSLSLRTVSGDIGILAGHADYVSAVGDGASHLTDKEGNKKNARCRGGIISVNKGFVRLVADEFEWD